MLALAHMLRMVDLATDLCRDTKMRYWVFFGERFYSIDLYESPYGILLILSTHFIHFKTLYMFLRYEIWKIKAL